MDKRTNMKQKMLNQENKEKDFLCERKKKNDEDYNKKRNILRSQKKEISKKKLKLKR